MIIGLPAAGLVPPLLLQEDEIFIVQVRIATSQIVFLVSDAQLK